MADTLGGLPGTEDVIQFLKEQAAAQKARLQGKTYVSGPTVAPSGPGVPSTMYSNPQLSEGEIVKGQLARGTGNPQIAEAEAIGGSEIPALVTKGPRGGGLLSGAILSALSGPAFNLGNKIGNMAELGASSPEAAGKRVKKGGFRFLPPSLGGVEYEKAPRDDYAGMTLPSPEEVSAAKGAPERTIPIIQMMGSNDSALALAGLSGKPAPRNVTPTSDQAPITVDIPQGKTGQTDLETISPEVVDTPQEQPVSIDDAIKQVLSNHRAVPSESASPASIAALQQLTQPKQVPKQGGFWHGLNQIVTSMDPRGFDTTRLARNESDLLQAQQRLTPQEELKAHLAEADVTGAQKFNREAKMKDYETGGMSPQDQAQLEMLSGEKKDVRQQTGRESLAKAEHGYRMDELKASAATQKLSPEQTRSAAGYKMLEQYPDLFTPEQIMQETGLQTNPEALSVIANARKKNEVMDMVLMKLFQDRGMLPSGGATPAGARPAGRPAPNLNLKALQK